ncbi:pimeloyl-ACP methyl ester carboxylesterase [Sphingomonas sp. UYAg733]
MEIQVRRILIIILAVAGLAAIALAVLLLVYSTPSHAAAAGQSTTTSRPAVSSSVEVAPGRSLHVVCMGDGPVTVLLDAGGSDWSSIWSTIQPRIASRARACSYDRAGLGLSDADSGPRTPAAIAEDLHALIQASAWKGPIVLVGHSLGGFNVKLYTALHPGDVAGLVLIDPSEERSWDRTRVVITRKYGSVLSARSELLDQAFLGRLITRFRDCAAAAREKGFEAGSIPYRRCTDPDRPQLDKAVAAERATLMGTSKYQSAQASEIVNSVYGTDVSDGVYARLFRPGVFRRLPMVVLTHVEPASSDPLDLLGTEQGILLHRQTAALSTRGLQRMVSGSSHYIHFDQPDVVLAAIDEVLAMATSRR